MRLNRFFVNSDYTSEKIFGSYSLNLYFPPTAISPSGPDNPYAQIERHADIVVPDKVYLENVYLKSSFAGEKYLVGPRFQFEPSSHDYVVVASLYRVNSTTYRLSVRAQNYTNNTITIPESSFQARLHLSIAP